MQGLLQRLGGHERVAVAIPPIQLPMRRNDGSAISRQAGSIAASWSSRWV